ncbi:MAG: Rpn family recombination-promoting nuclease/putative transposase [Deltaproteobacteria bacterium]|nr:Rpn family recombination-promoting nuclease/putative transposase [Deltaproteobacteria bacterium]
MADPIITAIFDDAARIGEATMSLANAVPADAGREPVRKILQVTPQRTHPATNLDGRSFRLDIEAVSGAGEVIHIEVRLKTFHRMTERNLLYSVASLYGNARRGDELSDVVKKMPRVIVIDILDFVPRPSSADFHQPAGLLHLEGPVERASDRLEIHMIQLPLFKAMAPDFKNPPHCRLTAIARARGQGKSLKEVVEMDPVLKESREADPGFAQFVDRHGIVASTPEMLKAYDDWQIAQMAWGEEIAWVEAKGIAKNQLNIALVLFRAVKPGDDSRDAIKTASDYGIPEDIIRAAKGQAEAECV